jgi:hypothetical protein
MPKATKTKTQSRVEKPIRKLVVISDLHCGSTVALMPPDYQTLEGQKVQQSKAQQWLWECWGRFQKEVEAAVGGEPWALLLNGDLTEGVHHRTVQVVSSDVSDHVGIAIDVLEPLAAKATAVFVVKGTECHTHSAEEAIARRLGARISPITGNHSADRWELEIGGVKTVARHHIPATIRDWLKGMQLSATLISEQAAAAGAGRDIPRVVLAAHRHTGGVYRDVGVGVCAVTPPWQLLTRYGHKVVPQAEQAIRCGGMILHYPGGGELPDVQDFTYLAPHPKAVIL